MACGVCLWTMPLLYALTWGLAAGITLTAQTLLPPVARYGAA